MNAMDKVLLLVIFSTIRFVEHTQAKHYLVEKETKVNPEPQEEKEAEAKGSTQTKNDSLPQTMEPATFSRKTTASNSTISREKKPTGRTSNVTVGFLLFEGIQPLDFVGPWDVFDAWSISAHRVQLLTIGKTKERVSSGSSLTFLPSHSLEEVTRLPPLSVLVIPGAKGPPQVLRDKAFLEQLAKVVQDAEAVLTVCTGASILQATGLLGDARVTTHWAAIPSLRKTGANVVEERVVQDGKLWSAGGVTSGIDLAISYLASREGRKVAGEVQLYLEYFPEKQTWAERGQESTLPPYEEEEGNPAKLPQYVIESYFTNVTKC